MGEDGEEDSIHGCLVLEGAHGACASSDFAESALDGVGGADRLALIGGFIAEAGEQFVEVVAQAGNGSRILVGEAIGEFSSSSAGGRGVGGVHDLAQGALDRWLIGLFDLVEG